MAQAVKRRDFHSPKA